MSMNHAPCRISDGIKPHSGLFRGEALIGKEAISSVYLRCIPLLVSSSASVVVAAVNAIAASACLGGDTREKVAPCLVAFCRIT